MIPEQCSSRLSLQQPRRRNEQRRQRWVFRAQGLFLYGQRPHIEGLRLGELTLCNRPWVTETERSSSSLGMRLESRTPVGSQRGSHTPVGSQRGCAMCESPLCRAHRALHQKSRESERGCRFVVLCLVCETIQPFFFTCEDMYFRRRRLQNITPITRQQVYIHKNFTKT